MSYQSQRPAGHTQAYRPMSPTTQGLDRLRYCREYMGQRRLRANVKRTYLRQPTDLPRYTDIWTRYSGYVPPAGPPRNPPWILQPYADHYDPDRHVYSLAFPRARGVWVPPRPVYVLHPPGQTPLRQHPLSQIRVKHAPGHRPDVNCAVDDREAGDNIESLATELSAMDGTDSSMYQLPIKDWRQVNWQDVTNHVWFHRPTDDRPQYWQRRDLHEVMTGQELQAEAKTRQLQLLNADKTYLLDVLKVDSEAFARQFKQLRNHSMQALRRLIVAHSVDIDIDYSYCRDDLAFLIADRIARDVVDKYNASLTATPSQEQRTEGYVKAKDERERSTVDEDKVKDAPKESHTSASGSTKRVRDAEGPPPSSKKPKVVRASADNVAIGANTDLTNEHGEPQASPVTNAEGSPLEAEAPETLHNERDTQPDRGLSEGQVFEDELTRKRSTTTKVSKSVMKRYFKD